MKFIGIWILNPLKTSGGQPVALGGFDLSVFLHDGLWCKVPLLWTLPYFVVFVTIMAFMVIQLGCSAFRICFW